MSTRNDQYRPLKWMNDGAGIGKRLIRDGNQEMNCVVAHRQRQVDQFQSATSWNDRPNQQIGILYFISRQEKWNKSNDLE